MSVYAVLKNTLSSALLMVLLLVGCSLGEPIIERPELGPLPASAVECKESNHFGPWCDTPKSMTINVCDVEESWAVSTCKSYSYTSDEVYACREHFSTHIATKEQCNDYLCWLSMEATVADCP